MLDELVVLQRVGVFELVAQIAREELGDPVLEALARAVGERQVVGLRAEASARRSS
jgi:hypothetical protein